MIEKSLIGLALFEKPFGGKKEIDFFPTAFQGVGLFLHWLDEEKLSPEKITCEVENHFP